tara:strand:- start:3272 stop:3625 length:354 start_codon:yes stop_codon:yes gene_type:complete
MGKITKTKVKIISVGKENIYKVSANSLFLKKIKEIYISEIQPKSQKKWKFSRNIQQNIYIFNTKIILLIKENKIKKIELNKKSSYLIQIPKKTHYTFKNVGSKTGFILNMLDKKFKK